MSRVAARLADVVRVPSAAAVHWAVTEDKVAAEKVRVIYNFAADPRPVSGEEVAQLRAYLGIGDGELVACSVARLRKEKQLELGIGARQLLEEQLGTPVHYVVVGDGPLRASLEAAAAGHTRVHFAGHQDDVWPWLALSDICWVPSANESFGIVAAEAMATGTPLVASRVGGLAEIITEGRGGRLVEPGSAEALASATAALMATQGGLASAGAHARRRYEEAFTSAAAALSLQRLYAELVKN